MPEANAPPGTAAMLAIGDEILSGRTRDRNIGHLAAVLTLAGIDLREVRIVPDEEAEIAAAVNALRDRYDFVFTSGGIGPTHDDITADAIGAAFGLAVEPEAEATRRLSAYYAGRDLPYTPARQRMSRMPVGASLIDNPVSVAPGFRVGNVHVMAGVPGIFAAMLDNVMATLPQGRRILSVAIPCPFGEGDIGDELAAIQKAHPQTAIGSYPRFDGERYTTELIVRSRDGEAMEAAAGAVRRMIEDRRPGAA